MIVLRCLGQGVPAASRPVDASRVCRAFDGDDRHDRRFRRRTERTETDEARTPTAG